jgi:ribose transport system ATP-binding protein
VTDAHTEPAAVRDGTLTTGTDDSGELETPQALQVRGLQKVYGGEAALSGADLTVGVGEIHGLLGANGAGKSTLVRIVCGVEHRDGGDITLFGESLPREYGASAVQKLGLAYIHQDRALAQDMSIADNIALVDGFRRNRLGLIDRSAVIAASERALAKVDLELDVRTVVGELSIAEQTLVAVARGLAVDARLILLDEPTANLGSKESARLYTHLRQLVAHGVSAVLITHALDEALEVCNRITVLRNGVTVCSQDAADLDADQLAAHIVGHAPRREEAARSANVSDGQVRLRLTQVCTEGLGPVDIEVNKGEVVGLTGLADSGHLQVGELLMAQVPLAAGSIEVDGASYVPSTVSSALDVGLGYVPPDRLRDGVAVELRARENLFLDGRLVLDTGNGGRGSHRTTQRLGRWARERRQSRRILTSADVRPPDPETTLSTMSGGNVQKVLIAKWLDRKPKTLVLSEPTIGVDIGAREDIYSRVRSDCQEGLAVLVTSSDFDEICKLCDRAVVLRYGRVVASVDRADLTVERLTALSSGQDHR